MPDGAPVENRTIQLWRRIFRLAAPLVITLMAGLASYSFNDQRRPSSSIPNAFPVFSLVLPSLTAIFIRNILRFLKPIKGAKPMTVQGLVAGLVEHVAEAVAGTIAATNITPKHYVTCALEARVSRIIRIRSIAALRRIQDTFHFTVHRPRSVDASDTVACHPPACPASAPYGHKTPCIPALLRSQRINGAVLCIVVLVIFVIKTSLDRSSTWCL